MILDCYASSLAPPVIEETVNFTRAYAASLGLVFEPPLAKEHVVGNARVADSEWKGIVQRNFSAISALSNGWAGPNSKRISDNIIYRADIILRDALEGVTNASAPYIVPAADGSVQIEWHTKKYELEFALASDGRPSAWLCNRETGVEIEAEGDKAIDLLFRWARQAAAPYDDGSHVHSAPEAEGTLLAA